MQIRPMREAEIPEAVRLWNAAAAREEMVYKPMTEARFRRKFLEGSGCELGFLLAAAEGDRLAGFAHGVPPMSFPLAQEGKGYLTFLMTAPEDRGRGVGRALCGEMERALRERGADTVLISDRNPVDLDWRIPGTPGHDHNNAPGLDLDSAGAGFFERMGFRVRVREIAMYTDLSAWRLAPEIGGIRRRLRQEGIETGVYDPDWDCEYDRMCDGVGSDYWRAVLRTEIAAWKAGEPNADPRFWADGRRPAGPRPLLTATHEGRIVGFTGPVDRQESGRGWFTGICTDPGYERKGIATVLFNLLMKAFQEEGAAFSTLFTGEENHARKVYERSGFRVVRHFGLMMKP